MKIPKTIKAGGMRYRVAFAPNHAINHGAACGETSFRNGTITVARDYCRQQQELIFLHELLHVAYDKAGLNTRFAPEVEEQMVDSLSNSLYDILTQNNMLK